MCDDDKKIMIHVPLIAKADFYKHNLTLKQSVNLLFGHLKISY